MDIITLIVGCMKAGTFRHAALHCITVPPRYSFAVQELPRGVPQQHPQNLSILLERMLPPAEPA